MGPAIQLGRKEALGGAQKCAIVCMALGQKEAAKVLQALTPEQVELVTREILSMDMVAPEIAQSVLAEFDRAAEKMTGLPTGGKPYARQILEQALGADTAASVLQKIGDDTKETGLDRLGKASPEILAGLLRAEHPQISATILSHLDPERAAKVLQGMDAETAADALYRIARMEKVSPEMLALVTSGFDDRAEVAEERHVESAGGPAAAAKLINLAGADLGKQFLEKMEGRDAETTGQIKALMFVFEDLVMVDGKGIQRILREVDTKELALAMKAASEELKKHIKSNMSERAGSALDEEIELLGPVRVRDVETAHAHIIEAVRQLDEAGEIIIRRPGGDSDIIQ
jgi:flagellar motor switch protein FliG